MNRGAMIYAGYMRPGETSLQRLRAFESLGFDVTPVNMLVDEGTGTRRKILYRGASFLFRKGCPVRLPDLTGANARLLQLAESETRYACLWLDKPLSIFPETLDAFRRLQPQCRIIAFAPDDMAARHNQSRQMLQSLSRLDAFVTTKSYNVEELRALGCPKVIFMDNGYDPETHHPVPVTPQLRGQYGGEVGFIGSYEEERALSLLALAKAGIPVRVWGGINWRQCRHSHPNLRIEYKELVGDRYAPAICAIDINLCFLRKLNRDLQTTRSVEIPACGAFMIAERSNEHLKLFDEDREAVFFSGNDELVKKTGYYRDHAAERLRIAEAGRRRCLAQGYDYASRLANVLAAWERG